MDFLNQGVIGMEEKPGLLRTACIILGHMGIIILRHGLVVIRIMGVYIIIFV